MQDRLEDEGQGSLDRECAGKALSMNCPGPVFPMTFPNRCHAVGVEPLPGVEGVWPLFQAGDGPAIEQAVHADFSIATAHRSRPAMQTYLMLR